VLSDIGAGDLPEILALNKWDLLDEVEQARALRRFPDGVPVSALTGDGLEALRERVAALIPRHPIEVTLMVPYERPEMVPWLHRNAEVLSVLDEDSGTRVTARVDESALPRIGEFVVEPVVARRSRG
jgi:GTP-binding protein HflX